MSGVRCCLWSQLLVGPIVQNFRLADPIWGLIWRGVRSFRLERKKKSSIKLLRDESVAPSPLISSRLKALSGKGVHVEELRIITRPLATGLHYAHFVRQHVRLKGKWG